MQITKDLYWKFYVIRKIKVNYWSYVPRGIAVRLRTRGERRIIRGKEYSPSTHDRFDEKVDSGIPMPGYRAAR